MSKLEVIFRLGLAHPLLIMDETQRRPSSYFSETTNEVWVEVQGGAQSEKASGEFDVLLLHVERECRPEDRDGARFYSSLAQWGVIGVYLLFVLPYAAISYYERYATPLIGVKVLLVLWATDRLLGLVWLGVPLKQWRANAARRCWCSTP